MLSTVATVQYLALQNHVFLSLYIYRVDYILCPGLFGAIIDVFKDKCKG